jgi:hypothetical protein
MAKLFHRREESQPQILRRDGSEKRPIQRFVFRPHGPNENFRSVAQRNVPFQFLGVGPDGEARMARRPAARQINGRYGYAGIHGNETVLVSEYGIKIELAQLGNIGGELRQLDQQQCDGIRIGGGYVAVTLEHA